MYSHSFTYKPDPIIIELALIIGARKGDIIVETSPSLGLVVKHIRAQDETGWVYDYSCLEELEKQNLWDYLTDFKENEGVRAREEYEAKKCASLPDA